MEILLPKLQCPLCKESEFKLNAFAFFYGDRVKTGEMICGRCSHKYLIEHGIAQLLPSGLRDAHVDQEVSGWEHLAREDGIGIVADELIDRLPYLPGCENEPTQIHWYQASLSFPIVQKLMGDLTGKMVLEIGASACWASAHFARMGGNVVSIDINSIPLMTAERYFAQGIYFHRMCANGENIPFCSNAFDYVFCCAAIHHTRCPDKLMAEIQRVLKPEGRFFAINEAFRPLFVTAGHALNSFKQTQLHLKYGINEQVFSHAAYRRFIQNTGLRFSSIIVQWDTRKSGGEISAIGENIALKERDYHISNAERSWARKFVQLTGVEFLLKHTRFAPRWLRPIVLHFTNSFRILVGTKTSRD